MPDELDIAVVATVLVTPEAPGPPVDHAFDRHRGPGGTRWVAGEPGQQTLIPVFDALQVVRRVAVEIEEPEVARTQKLVVIISGEGGRTYRELLR